MRNKKLLASGIICLGAIAVMFVADKFDKISEKSMQREHQHLVEQKEEELPETTLDITAEGFSTHLPLVILNTDGQKILSKLDTDGDPRISINVQIIDNKNGLNSIGDKPAVDTQTKIRYRGNSSLYHDKKQYGLKFINEDGTDNDVEVMGMEAGCDWVLNGTFLDKSLIRNYISYNIAGEIMGYAPNIRFCEVFINDGQTYTYQGLYTMIESIERSATRVNITKYDENRTESSYIIRRDRYSEDEVMLHNYGTVNGITQEWLGVKYPSASKITDATLKYIENDISTIEKILYSDDYEVFKTYSNYINVDSFIDYHIINEYFGNYDAGIHSTYAYKDLTGKLTMGPVWDYDGAMDNATLWELKTNALAFQSSSWFDALIKDEEYCRKLEKRYNELRQNVLSDEYIDKYIDETVEYLGKAIDRNQIIWGYIYDLNLLINDPNEYGIVNNRNVKTYDEEISRIKLALHRHANYMDSNLYRDLSNNVIYEPEHLNAMALLAVFFVVGFFIIVIFVRQE